MRYVLIVLLGLCYLFNSVILEKIYPFAHAVCGEWDEYVMARFKVFDFYAVGTFLLGYVLAGKGTVLKWICCGLTILAAGSAIDKCFGITTYLKSDILLIIFAIVISVYGFIRESGKLNNGN